MRFKDLVIFMTAQALFGIAVPYAILLYNGHPYIEVITLEYHATSTECYFDTFMEDFEHKMRFVSLF